MTHPSKPGSGQPAGRPGFLSRIFGWRDTPAGTAPGAAPTRIGHYEITGTLGQGGMGIVYVARDDRLQRTVALKMMTGMSDDAARKRFWREARAAASVNHPNICQMYE